MILADHKGIAFRGKRNGTFHSFYDDNVNYGKL